MAEKDEGLMAEFAEFLEAKKASEAEANAADDYEVEVWDKEGRGARVRRSHAKPFLQSLGIDLDPPTDDSGDDKDKDKGKKAPPKGPTTTASASVSRRYFGKAAGK